MATTKQIDALAHTYSVIAEWFLYPEQVDPYSLTEQELNRTWAAAHTAAPEVEQHLRSFHQQRSELTLEQYVALLELNPRCPLYLGTYQFEEPKSCNAAGVSDRNTYMLEIGNIYRHFGFELRGELPDYLPAMAEFLTLSAGCDADDALVRQRFIDKLMIRGLRLFTERLKKEDGPYKHLAQALLLCLESEAGPNAGEDVIQPANVFTPVAKDQQLIQIEGVASRG